MNSYRIAFVLISFVLAGSQAVSAADFYVAPNGSDANPGTRRKPFATLERARDEVRKGNAAARSGQATTIWLRGGVYLRTNSLELGTVDSGTLQAPITWRAAKGETVRLLGGCPLEVSELTPVSDPAVLQRLSPAAREHVRQIKLPSTVPQGSTLASRGFGRPTTPSHCELFFNGKPMTLARWPNEGSWEQIAGFPADDAQDDGHGGKIGKVEQGFFYAGDRPRSWKEPGKVWVHGYWSWDWANSYEGVKSIDHDKRWVRTAAPYGLYGFRKGQRFYFLNILEELDSPGEYFVDHTSGILYFWPPSPVADAGASSGELIVSMLSRPLVQLTDVSHVKVLGLSLEAVRSNAIVIRGGSSNLIADCLIRNIGNYGAMIEGGFGHGVSGCDVFDTGDGGVSLNGGDRKSLQPSGHFVDNCHFARQGRWSKCYVPAVLMGGVGTRVSHNLIHDHPHCAILFTGNDHCIEFNEIHHIALETGDVGAIYTGRDYTYRGNRVRHNFIHHTGGVGMGSMGVYMDDCVSGTEIYGNVFYKVQRAAFLGGGRDHQVSNNIFVECDHAVELDGRGLDKSPVWYDMVDKTMRHSLKDVPADLYRDRYPAIRALDAYYGPPNGPSIEKPQFQGVPPENNLVARNICVGKWLNVYWNAKREMLKLEGNLTEVDPLFAGRISDASTIKDFGLTASSPAWKKGFEKIPTEQIGLAKARR